MNKHDAVDQLEQGVGVGWYRGWFLPLALFIAAAALYMLNLERFPHHDELYHILAARGLLEFGEPRIEQGTYERVFAYTWLLAKLFGLFGESLSVARMPSVIGIAAVVGLIYVWLRPRAGVAAALFASVLFALSPFSVDMALFTRFYAFQTLAFFITAMFVYASLEKKGPEAKGKNWLIYLAGVLIAGLIAVYLQKTSLIGFVGLGFWFVCCLFVPWCLSDGVDSKRKITILAGIVVVLVLVALIAIQTGVLAKIWGIYQTTPLFNQSRAHEFWFYLVRYQLYYPTLWPALALITFAALATRFKPAFFAAVVFFISLGLSSFAAAKGLRYIIYAQPFLFILIGMGLAAMLEPIRVWLREMNGQFAVLIPLRAGLANFVSVAMLVASLMILVTVNPAVVRTVGLLANITVPPDQPTVDWKAASAEINPWIQKADIVVTMAELEMLYYYQTYDLLLSASRLTEMPDSVDFDADYRTGKPVVGSLDAMRLVFSCYPSGIFITNKRRWRHPDYISTAVADLVETNTVELTVPGYSRVKAFTWDQAKATKQAENCAELPIFNESSTL